MKRLFFIFMIALLIASPLVLGSTIIPQALAIDNCPTTTEGKEIAQIALTADKPQDSDGNYYYDSKFTVTATLNCILNTYDPPPIVLWVYDQSTNKPAITPPREISSSDENGVVTSSFTMQELFGLPQDQDSYSLALFFSDPNDSSRRIPITDSSATENKLLFTVVNKQSDGGEPQRTGPLECGAPVYGQAQTCPVQSDELVCCPSACPATPVRKENGEESWFCGYDKSLLVSPEPTATPPLQPCQSVAGKIPENCNTAIGAILSSPGGFIQSLLTFFLSISGMIAVYLIVRSGYQLMTSRGNPEAIQEAKERLTAAVIGLLFIIFSLVMMSIVAVDFLKLPGFGE